MKLLLIVEEKINKVLGNISSADNVDSSVRTRSEISKDMDFEEYRKSRLERNEKGKKQGIENEYELYLFYRKNNSDIGDVFWEKFKNRLPTLFLIYKYLESIPINESSVERTFFVMRFVLDDLRMHMLDVNLDNLFLLNLNRKKFE